MRSNTFQTSADSDSDRRRNVPGLLNRQAKDGQNFTHGEVAGEAFITRIRSPFVIDDSAQACLLNFLPESQDQVEWVVDDIDPEKVYSISFFALLADSPDHALNHTEHAYLQVYSGSTLAVTERLIIGRKPVFYNRSFTFQTPEVRILLYATQPCQIIVGHFGEALPASRIMRTTSPYYNKSIRFQAMPEIELPEAYRGLKDFTISAVMGTRREELFQPPLLEEIVVRSKSHPCVGLLPRILPGRNRLIMTQNDAGPGSALNISVRPRDQPAIADVRVMAHRRIPADGATFGRVIIYAIDGGGRIVPGAYFRLQSPPEVSCFAYRDSVSERRSDLTWAEFHLTSLKAGSYNLSVDVWDGSQWQETAERIAVEFSAGNEPATQFQRIDYPNEWHLPQAADGPAQESLNFSFSAGANETRVPFNIHSDLAPEISWEIIGPLNNFGVRAVFQPDSRSLSSLGRSLRDFALKRNPDDPEQELVGLIEEYVGLLRESTTQQYYQGVVAVEPARSLRSGRGWCGSYAQSVLGLGLASGLHARIVRTQGSAHVLTELKGELLPPVVVDANLDIRCCSQSGARLPLTFGQGKLLGFDVGGYSRRCDERRLIDQCYPDAEPLCDSIWWAPGGNDPEQINRMLDDSIFKIDLQPWERLEWRSGYLDEELLSPSRPLEAAVNSTALTKTAVLHLSKYLHHPALKTHGLERVDGAVKISDNQSSGNVSFELRSPVEIDMLQVFTRGIPGDGGSVRVDMTPIIEHPLIQAMPEQDRAVSSN